MVIMSAVDSPISAPTKAIILPVTVPGRNADGMYRIIGRVDDVINVSGHRFGTAEIEDAINSNQHVVESAVVGYPHPIKGQGIFAYVVAGELNTDQDSAKSEIVDTVAKEIGRIAIPEKILIVSGLPKTRSGKIMRRILRKIAEGDTSNLGEHLHAAEPRCGGGDQGCCWGLSL